MTTTTPRHSPEPTPDPAADDGPRDEPEHGDARGTTARLAALRAALADHDPAAATPGQDSAGGQDATTAADELADRLVRRRSAGHVAAAYSAAHGHPTSAHERSGRRRWALTTPVAVVASAALTVLALGVLVVASWPQPVVPAVPAADVQLDGATGPAGPVESEVAEPPVGDDSLADQEPAPADRGPAGSVPAPVAGSAGVEVVVHVVGQVARPGLVGLPAGARVADAVEAAGGASDGADLAALNLARTVTDGEQVYVPAPGEEVPAPPPTRSAGGGAAEEPTAPVRVNEADASTLATLPGIGPVLAERIVARRDENGPFTQVDQLAEVSGIGPVLLDELRDLVTV
ncbi:hypothetical protein GCM10023216_28890 [Isoptericola chiayiensis]|uniref:Helix-hairpin-helix DNA-binding motif class 1 domain-containing protein n=1 Tax=Isoptericola chiayiensis TaxID=579446 RepID=A0ABP8YSX5_9MICO|nr:competence protein ComEA [Isoptericola chiayiensis]